MLLVNNNILGFSYLFCCCLLSGDGTLSVLNIRRQSVQERSDHLDGELLSVAVVKVIWSPCYSSTSTISLIPKILKPSSQSTTRVFMRVVEIFLI